MREFAVVSRRSAPLPGALERKLAQPALDGSLFLAEHATSVALHNGHTVAAFRYLKAPEGTRADRFFDGAAVRGGQSITDEMATDGIAPRDLAEHARGVFTLVSIESGQLSIFSDPLSVYPLWLWQSSDLFVCSNNAHLIRSVLASLGISIEKNAHFFAWQLIFQNGVTDSTGYENVGWMPFGHYATVSFGEGAIEFGLHPLSACSVERLCRHGLSTTELIDKAQEEIAENVSALANSDFRTRVCDLSGGLDTRLMVAAVLAGDLGDRFGFNTAGTRLAPDGNVAALIVNGHPKMSVDGHRKMQVGLLA